MGMFDSIPDWLPEDPAKHAAAKMGLMQFGAALMGGRGSLGQILGGGLQAGMGGYQSTLAQQQKAALDAAQGQHWALQNKVLQNTLDEPMQLAQIAQGVGQPAAGGGIAPVSALPQIGATPQASAPRAPQPQGAAPQKGYEYYVSLAQAYANAGKTSAAQIAMKLANDLKPKLKETRVMTVDGQRVMANTYEDGSVKKLDGFAPDLEKIHFQDTGGAINGLDPFTGKPLMPAMLKSVTPGEALQSSDQAKSRAQADRHFKATQDAAGANDQAPITDAAILNAAARYNLDGTLPPMGMGKAAAAGRSAILNKAAELASGIDPTDQRKNQIGAKNELASQGKAVKEFTSGKLGNSVRSFNVSLSHLETLGTLADALHNGDAKMVNKVGNYFAEQTGGAAPTNFDAAKKIVGDEIVKAIVGSGGGVHDREEAARVIASANSPAQLKGAIDTYKELMRGQLHGLRQQYETSTGKNDFDRFLSPHAKEAVKPVKDLPQKPASAAGAKFLGFEK
jgi:hypothetical protein